MNLQFVRLLGDVPDVWFRLLSHLIVEDSLLQNLALRRLGVAKIHHLVEEFIDDNKIIAN